MAGRELVPRYILLAESTDEPFNQVATDVAQALLPLGFPENGIKPLEECLKSISRSGMVGAIVLDVVQQRLGRIVSTPTLRFNVVLKSDEDGSEEQLDEIEKIGSYHDTFFESVNGKRLFTTKQLCTESA